jgi:outer membrane lipoprotein SlyB
MIKIASIVVASLLAFSGCATNEGPTYDGNSYSQIKKYEIGIVTQDRPVVISDDGTGKFLGALVGAVLGSTVGGGDGKSLAMLGGGLAGYYAGNEIGKANGDELTVKLDNGNNIVVVVKGKHLEVGDRVKIIRDGNKVAQVDKVTP